MPAAAPPASKSDAGAGVCLAPLSDRLRLFWQDSATTLIYAADSLDNGVTWSAPASLFDAGGTAAGIGADGATTMTATSFITTTATSATTGTTTARPPR